MDECDYKSCSSDAYRHFWMHHFCNEHNWYLRRKAAEEKPSDLDAFVNKFVE